MFSHTGNITSMGFQKDGKWLFTGSEDGTIKLWDLRAKGPQREYDNKVPVNAVALHPNQAELLFGDHNGQAQVLDLASNKVSFCEQKEGDVPIRSVATSSDGTVFVAANNSGNCYLWDPSSPHARYALFPGMFSGMFTGIFTGIFPGPRRSTRGGGRR